MAELVTVDRFAIPEFAAFPLKKSTLDDYLGSLPQEVIRLSFMSWSSDTGFKRRLASGHSKKAGVRVPDETRILRTYYNLRNEQWCIWIHPVRKTMLAPIKAALVPDALVRLRSFLLNHTEYDGTNTQRPGTCEIAFDGHTLIFRD